MATGSDPFPLRFRWAGAQFDEETGLYYLRNRYYDPGLGRFTQEDPAGYWGGSNLFAYAGNPAETRDPDGLAPDPGVAQYRWERSGYPPGDEWIRGCFGTLAGCYESDYWATTDALLAGIAGAEASADCRRDPVRCALKSYDGGKTPSPSGIEKGPAGNPCDVYVGHDIIRNICRHVSGPQAPPSNRCTASCLAQQWLETQRASGGDLSRLQVARYILFDHFRCYYRTGCNYGYLQFGLDAAFGPDVTWFRGERSSSFTCAKTGIGCASNR